MAGLVEHGHRAEIEERSAPISRKIVAASMSIPQEPRESVAAPGVKQAAC
jgi:hypothetical protein